LADFIADLEIQGRSVVYKRFVKSRSASLFKECGWRFFKDLNADDFVSWRTKQKHIGPKTLNDYLDAINVLVNWCIKNRRTLNNPFLVVAKVEVRGKQVRRRAYTDDELNRLVGVSPKRRLLYLTAAYTGLRFNELKELLVLDTHLGDANPHFKVRSSTIKNKKDAFIPMWTRSQVASSLDCEAKSTRPLTVI